MTTTHAALPSSKANRRARPACEAVLPAPARTVVITVISLVTLWWSAPRAAAQSVAAVTGIVFEDTNGNGTQDDGEAGLSGVTINVVHDETGAATTLATDPDGSYRFEIAPPVNHRFSVDETTLPFTAQLTTGREEYNLNVPSGFTAFNVNFGYQETEPAVVTGIVFQDANGNGTQDDGEAGLSGVTIDVVHDETGAATTLATDPEGSYRFEAMGSVNHRASVDEATLPFNAQLTTGRETYNLNVPPGFIATNVNFGYQEVEPAAVTGIVFRDANGNGTQDDGEATFSGVTIDIVHDQTGATTTLVTDANGRYRFETSPRVNHQVSVDEATLPFNAQLTTGRETYNLNVPPGFIATNVNFGYQEVEPAAVTGIVFRDANGNGTQDDGEAAVSGVTIDIVHDQTGAATTLVTDANGQYRFETSPRVNHQVSVDEATLPFTAQLTTGREMYNLNVPPGFTAPNVNFGYQEIEPSAASGTVFHDVNGNGNQDAGEPGIPQATVEIVQRISGETTTLSTGPDGGYRYETSVRRFDVSVDVSTLPFVDPALTAGREVYALNVPSGFIAPNINFGYQDQTEEEPPELQSTGEAPPAPPEQDEPGPVDDRTDPFDDPDPDMPLPDDLPDDAGDHAFPLEGPWVVYHQELTMTCSGMPMAGMTQPPLRPQRGTIRLEDEGRTLIGDGLEGDRIVLTASDDVRGLYTGTIGVSQMGNAVDVDFYLQVVTPSRIIGYIDGEGSAGGMTCQLYRPFHMEYDGG